MQVHLAASLLVVGVGLFLHLSFFEWVAVVFAVFFVLAAETVNTAIEAVVDLCTSEIHPLAKVAKDCAAGAVLLAVINSLVVAYLVLWPHIKAYLG